VPEKLDRCVSDVKSKGGTENPWAVCNASIGKETTEKVNQNRQDPYPSPNIKKGKIEPSIQKTPKGIGGKNPISENKKQQEALLYKQILDTKLRQSNGRSKKR
jgi:hypothetical protein